MHGSLPFINLGYLRKTHLIRKTWMKTIMASLSPSKAPTPGWRVHFVANSSTDSGIKEIRMPVFLEPFRKFASRHLPSFS